MSVYDCILNNHTMLCSIGYSHIETISIIGLQASLWVYKYKYNVYITLLQINDSK